ncbi:MAG: protein kinase [Kofleriaceae bacterium]
MRHVSVPAVCPGEETVAAYVAGRLARDERDLFESHLDTCSACHELLAALGKAARDQPTTLGGALAGELEGATSWAPGDQLGRYVLLAQIGEGGMGIVYAAYDPELDRKVALKLVRHTGEAMRERLREEARAIAKLAHPNVVAVHDVGDAGGDVFVAMEHVDGETLRDWLRGDRTPAQIIAAFAQAGHGLAAAHEVGLVHRDVKPSNIIVGRDGRSRVVDFGLARARAGDDGVVGTPAYMAPEQKRGDAVDARADQFAFCVALLEALAGKPVRDRIARAANRGSAEDPAARFPDMPALLRELEPPRPRSRWLVVAIGVAALVTMVILLTRGHDDTPSCKLAGQSIHGFWGAPQRAELRAAFDHTGIAYAPTAAATAIAQLDAWTERWQRSATASCTATLVDRVQPVEVGVMRQACLAQLAERLAAVVALTKTADRSLVANSASLATALPAPERCDDVAALTAVAPPTESQRADVAKLRQRMATTEAEMIAGRLDRARPDIEALALRAETIGYEPVRARALLLVARLEQATTRYPEAIAALHAGARAATASRDLELLAEIWIELTQTLGNDVATLDQADVFDGYAAALVPLQPDREALELQLDFARCNRNVSHTRANDAATLAKHCESTIARALAATPPRANVANAARVRLGHFQRLLGKADVSRATLVSAVTEAVEVHGAQHPDTAVARYSLGIAELALDHVEPGIDQLRQALAIRRAAFPGNSLYVAESLVGLADAVSTKGGHAEAVTLTQEALGMIAMAKPGHVLAVNANILLGMSLEELERDEEARTAYLRAADIADAIPHRENLTVMALGLAAEVDARKTRVANAVAHLERALELLEQAKATPLELGRTQHRLAELLVELGPTDRRARAMAEVARASYVAAKATEPLAKLDAFMKSHHWR